MIGAGAERQEVKKSRITVQYINPSVMIQVVFKAGTTILWYFSVNVKLGIEAFASYFSQNRVCHL